MKTGHGPQTVGGLAAARQTVIPRRSMAKHPETKHPDAQPKRAKDARALQRLAVAAERLAAALDRAVPPAPPATDLKAADAFVWSAPAKRLLPIDRVNALPLDLLVGVEPQKKSLARNTRAFADGLPANNALLWGARGMGKSSLVKSVHRAILEERAGALALLEIHREDIGDLPALLRDLRVQDRRFVVLCDDLSFDTHETTYKSLKSALEGGLEGRPANVLFYATSNRRHLMARDMIDNEQSTAINPGEAVEEKVSLSDRFGLWIGFRHCSQADYLAMVEGYRRHFKLQIDEGTLKAEALEWATTRGARSGRVAYQFIQDLAGRLGQPL
ncbi:MAG: ATP-binding protein [Pseudomonadota bacterium]